MPTGRYWAFVWQTEMIGEYLLDFEGVLKTLREAEARD